MPGERLQKVLAAAGFGSRRACEMMITDGRVSVNGEITDTLPVLVDPEHDRILVDGKPARAERHVYYLLHKPKGVFCTNDDPDSRLRAVDLLRGVRERVHPVGRLDAEATGLLLFTNDGELSDRLTHPRYGVPKTYAAEVHGWVSEEALARVREGVWLSEGKSSPTTASILSRQRDRTTLQITMREGRNREVRRVMARVGHKVLRLKRVGIGPLRLKGIAPGAFRHLTPAELRALRDYVQRPPRAKGEPRGENEPRPPTPPRAMAVGRIAAGRASNAPRTASPLRRHRTSRRPKR